MRLLLALSCLLSVFAVADAAAQTCPTAESMRTKGVVLVMQNGARRVIHPVRGEDPRFVDLTETLSTPTSTYELQCRVLDGLHIHSCTNTFTQTGQPERLFTTASDFGADGFPPPLALEPGAFQFVNFAIKTQLRQASADGAKADNPINTTASTAEYRVVRKETFTVGACRYDSLVIAAKVTRAAPKGFVQEGTLHFVPALRVSLRRDQTDRTDERPQPVTTSAVVVAFE